MNSNLNYLRNAKRELDIKRKALSSPCEVPRALNLARNSAK